MIVLTSAFVLLSAFSCGGGGKATGTNEQSEKVVVNVPQFDADSAYLYVKNQVDFGPRVPNTKEHVACGNYLAGKLEAFGAKVTNQYADLIAYDGTLLKARNIIGSYKPESKKRIALFAHWDTRPWADNDADEKNHHTPILGANDGASGVGALLEIARLVNQQQPELGIDIIFLDAEDYGTPQFYEGKHKEEAWEFLKWWVSADTQYEYSSNVEALLGVSGRIASSNPEAISRLSWDKESLEVILLQWKKVKEIPEAPGSYYVSRSIDQAFWAVYNDKSTPKEAITDWARVSDEEIKRKIEEYADKAIN